MDDPFKSSRTDTPAGTQGWQPGRSSLEDGSVTRADDTSLDVARDLESERLNPDRDVPLSTNGDRQGFENYAATDVADGTAPADVQRDADDPLTDANGVGTFEGKKVFSPNELNQSGEDKEYFPPKEDHQFHAPNDANQHALKPSLDMRPGATDPTPQLKRD